MVNILVDLRYFSLTHGNVWFVERNCVCMKGWFVCVCVCVWAGSHPRVCVGGGMGVGGFVGGCGFGCGWDPMV